MFNKMASHVRNTKKCYSKFKVKYTSSELKHACNATYDSIKISNNIKQYRYTI